MSASEQRLQPTAVLVLLVRLVVGSGRPSDLGALRLVPVPKGPEDSEDVPVAHHAMSMPP
jgi:hypothetical protein